MKTTTATNPNERRRASLGLPSRPVEPPADGSTTHITLDEFNRWLSLQEAMGWKVKNPESVANIRAEFAKGSTVAPFRKVS